MVLVHGHFVQFHHAFAPGCQGKGGNGLLPQKPEMNLSARIQNLTFWVGQNLDVIGFKKEVCLQSSFVQVKKGLAVGRVKRDKSEGLQFMSHESKFGLKVKRV